MENQNNSRFGLALRTAIEILNQAYPVFIMILVFISIIWQVSFWSVFNINPFEFFTLTSIVSSTLQNLLPVLMYVIFSVVFYSIGHFYISDLPAKRKWVAFLVIIIIFLGIIPFVKILTAMYGVWNLIMAQGSIFALIIGSKIDNMSGGAHFSNKLSILFSLGYFVWTIQLHATKKAERILNMQELTIVSVETRMGDSQQSIQMIHLGVIGDFIFLTKVDLSGEVICLPLSQVSKLEFP